MDIDKFITVPEDVSGFGLPFDNPDSLLPEQVGRLGFTSVKGYYEGYLSDFTTELDVNSDAGYIHVKGGFSDKNPDKVPVFTGEIQGINVHLGSLFENQQLGTMNLEMDFGGRSPIDSDFELTLNGWVQDFEYREHNYEKIILGGKVLGRSYQGRVIVKDSALNLDFNGLVDFNDIDPVFNFSLDLENAFLNMLNLSERGDNNNLKGHFAGNFIGMDTEAFIGDIFIDSVYYSEDDKKYFLNHLKLTRTQNPGQKPDSIRLRSDYIDGDMAADFVLNHFLSQLAGIVLGQEIDEQTRLLMEQDPQYVEFNFRLKNVKPITELFLPKINISPGTTINGIYKSGEQFLEVNGFTEEFSVRGIDFKGIRFSGMTSFDIFTLELFVERLVLQQDEDGNWLGIDSLTSGFVVDKDEINYTLQWDNKLIENINKGKIEGFAKIKSMQNIEAGIYKANAIVDSIQWEIVDENRFSLDSSAIGIYNFEIIRGDQSFTVDGKLSDYPEDTLQFSFENWSLVNFNPLAERISLKLDGIVNGGFGIFRNYDKTNFFAGIGIDDFSLNDVYFGDAEFRTRWLENEKALATDLNIFSRGSMEKPYKILGVNGFYYPFDNAHNFEFDIIAQNLNISFLEPLLSSFSSHIDGFATGRLTLDGTEDEPLLLGRLKLQRSELKIDYLNVIYSFSNEVEFKKDLIQFSDLTVYDPNSNTATLTGGLRHNYFKDMSIDLTIKPENLLAIDLNRYQNEAFYGKAFATGTVLLTGPLKNISINLDVKTEEDTKVAIPLHNSVDVSQTDFIIFTGNEETVNVNTEKDLHVTGLSLDMAIDVTRDADIEIFLPGNVGNIRAKGDGKLRFGVDPNGYLTLNGSYIIQSGLFVFSFEQLVSRRFDILEGSKISWTGDVYSADVSIVARYRLRTSLEGLGISIIDPDMSSQKVIVNTDIRMSGNLFNPDLTFGISFPNMQEQTRQAVYAVLDTNDLGLMNQPALSLLVLGSFSSTGTGGTNPVNPAAIVSSTLSNMLSKISNDFNIGINYIPGDQVSSEQLEVALSTQLLDDRLIIDGNIDVSGSSDNSQETSSIVGDINIEYKLTPDGRFRVKAFNRSNDLTLFNDYAPYTQGVGVFYRKEFNNLQDLFRKSGPGKKGRKQKN